VSCDLIGGGDINVDLFIVEGRVVNEVGHIFSQNLRRRSCGIHALEKEVKDQQPCTADLRVGGHLELTFDLKVSIENLLKG
jgi:hypothetical protein